MQLRDLTNLLRSAVDMDYLKIWSTELDVVETLTEIWKKLNEE